MYVCGVVRGGGTGSRTCGVVAASLALFPLFAAIRVTTGRATRCFVCVPANLRLFKFLEDALHLARELLARSHLPPQLSKLSLLLCDRVAATAAILRVIAASLSHPPLRGNSSIGGGARLVLPRRLGGAVRCSPRRACALPSSILGRAACDGRSEGLGSSEIHRLLWARRGR